MQLGRCGGQSLLEEAGAAQSLSDDNDLPDDDQSLSGGGPLLESSVICEGKATWL